MSKTREYIKEKNIEVLFEELMRYVINKKPDNPVKYLISLLQQKGETIIAKKPKTKISSDGPTRSRSHVSQDLSCAGQAIDIRKSLERVLPKSFDSKPVIQEQDISHDRSVSAPPATTTIEVRVPSTESAPDIANESEDVEKEEAVKETKQPIDEGDDSIVVSQECVSNVESIFNFGRKKKKSEGSLASGSTATLKDDASDKDDKADDEKKNNKKKDDKTKDADNESGEKSNKSKKKEKDKKTKAKREKEKADKTDVTENEKDAENGTKKDKKKKKGDENSDEANDKKKKHRKEKEGSQGEEIVDVVEKAEAPEYCEQNGTTEGADNSEKEANGEGKMEDTEERKLEDSEEQNMEGIEDGKLEDNVEGKLEDAEQGKMEDIEKEKLKDNDEGKLEDTEEQKMEGNEEGKMEEPVENSASAEEGVKEQSPRQEVKECDINSVMMTASLDLTELVSWRDGEMEIESVLDVGGSAVEQSSVRGVQSAAPPSTHIIKQILYCQSEDIILKEEVFFAVKSVPGGKVGRRVTSPCNTVFFDEPAEELPVLPEPAELVAVFKIPENRLPEQRERILMYRNSGNSDDMSISELTGSPWNYADSIS